jgi:hypothetical protein
VFITEWGTNPGTRSIYTRHGAEARGNRTSEANQRTTGLSWATHKSPVLVVGRLHTVNHVLPSAIGRILFRFMVTTTRIAVQVCGQTHFLLAGE